MYTNKNTPAQVDITDPLQVLALRSLPMAPETAFSEPLFNLAERLVIPPPARSGELNTISGAIGRLHGACTCGGLVGGLFGPMGLDSCYIHLCR